MNFESIKQFFIERENKFVCYKILSSEEVREKGYLSDYICNNILNNSSVQDFFVIEFPSSSKSELVHIDSLDSFVFNFYFINYGDKIVINDAVRTFECGVEAAEGNGVLADKLDLVQKYLTKNGLSYEEGAIVKQTSINTFVKDTIDFTRVLQTLNNIQPFPPYILELDEAAETVDVLTRTWLNGEELKVTNAGLELALFDNHKGLWQNLNCYQNEYSPFGNKHRYVALTFNEDGKVLVSKSANGLYDFAIHGYVLKDETYSLEALQRSISTNFGFNFFFGEVAPSVTIVDNKVITDFYVIKNYNVELGDLAKNDNLVFEWITKKELFTIISAGSFYNYSKNIIEYLYEIK